MQKGQGVVGLSCIVALLFVAGTVLVLAAPAGARMETENYAETALVQVEKAIVKAKRAMAEAEKAKVTVKKENANGLEQMVSSGYFPEDFSITEPDTSVIAEFSHRKHTEREKLKCIECHPKVFMMKVGKGVVKKGRLTMEEMQKGKYCASCHNGQKAFSVASIKHCKRCHPKQ